VRIRAETDITILVIAHRLSTVTMADRIVVMHDGIVEQIGTPLELYDRPENLFVAQFIGSPAMNIVHGTLRQANGMSHVETPDGIRWPLGPRIGADGQAVSYGVRPDHLELAANQPGTVPAEVVVVEPTGSETELVVRIGDAQMIVETHGRPKLAPGDRVTFLVEPGNVHLFDQQTGQRLSA
jgi:multiple sugar transport system ATP-binding protein